MRVSDRPTSEQQRQWANGHFDAEYDEWRNAISAAAPDLPRWLIGRLCLIKSGTETMSERLHNPTTALGGRTMNQAVLDGDLAAVLRVVERWEEFLGTARIVAEPSPD